MGAWQIPLEAARPAPGPNAYDYAMKGQDQALNAQSLMQQQQQRQQQMDQQAALAPEQLRAVQMENQQRQQTLDATASLRKAIQAGYTPDAIAQPGAMPPPPPQNAQGLMGPQQPQAPQAPGQNAQALMNPQQPPDGSTGSTFGVIDSSQPPPQPAPPQAAPPAGPMAAPPAAPPGPQNAQALMAPGGAQQPQQPHPLDLHTAGTPLPPFNFNKAVASLIADSHGELVPGAMGQQADMMIKQATLAKDQAATHSALATEAAQMLQAIPKIQGSTPQETQQLREQAYQHILPDLNRIEQQVLPNSQIPQHWDDATGAHMIAIGTTVADFNSRMHQTADLAARLKLETPKAFSEAQSQVLQDVGGATNQQQYSDILGKYGALAANEKRLDPNGTSFYGAVLNTLPKTFSRDVAIAAQIDPLKPDQRVKFFKDRLDLAAQKLSAAAQQGQAAYAAALGAVDPEERALFPPATGAFDPEKVASVAASVGQSGEQKITAQNAMQYKEDLLSLRQQMVNISRDRADHLDNTPPHQTVQQHKDMISGLADKVLSDSVTNGGRGIADARSNLDPAKGFYGNSDVDKYRGEVDAELRNRQQGDTREQQGEKNLNKNTGGGLAALQAQRDAQKKGANSTPVPPVKTSQPAPSQPVKTSQPAPVKTQTKSGATRTLTQADAERLKAKGINGYKAGDTLTFDGTSWK